MRMLTDSELQAMGARSAEMSKQPAGSFTADRIIQKDVPALLAHIREQARVIADLEAKNAELEDTINGNAD